MAWSNAVGWNSRRGWNNPAAGGGGGGSGVTWDPLDFEVADTFGNARIQLDATKLIATSFNSAGGFCAITSTDAIPATGKTRFEVKANAAGGALTNPGLAPLALKNDGAGGGLYGRAGALLWAPTGHVYMQFADQGIVAPTYVDGDWTGVELDMDLKRAFFVVNGGARSAFLDISSLGTVYAAADCGNSNGNHATLNAGGSAWNTTATAGYGGIP